MNLPHDQNVCVYTTQSLSSDLESFSGDSLQCLDPPDQLDILNFLKLHILDNNNYLQIICKHALPVLW